MLSHRQLRAALAAGVITAAVFGFARAAHAQELQIGNSCSGGTNSADWDTIAQCSGGTYVRASLILGSQASTSTGCSSTNAGQVQYSGGAFYGCTGSNPWVQLASSIAGQQIFAAGTVSAPGLAVSGDISTGLFQATTGTLSVTAEGTEAVRFLKMTGANTYVTLTGGNSAAPTISVGGTSSGLVINTAGTGALNFETNSTTQAEVTNTASAVNYVTITGAATTKPVEIAAAGSDTNVGLVLQPQGTGFLSNALPDSTSVGGNTPGAGAISLVTGRSAAAQAATGTNSVAIGYQTTASVTGSTAIGYGATASGSGTGALALGEATASASGIAIGSFSATVSSIGSNAIGNGVLASASQSTVLGTYATDHGHSELAFAEGSICCAVGGDAQFTVAPMFTTAISDTSSHRIFVNGGTSVSTSNCLNLSSAGVRDVNIKVIAFDTTTYDVAVWTATDVVLKRGSTAASTTLVGSPTFTQIQNTGGGSVNGMAAPTLTADTTKACLSITVTFANSDTSHVVAVVEGAEVY